MCGGIRKSGRDIVVEHKSLIPRDWTVRENGQAISHDIPLSYWRFIRTEKILTYWQKFVEEWVQLHVDAFYEKNQWFELPESRSILLGIYYDDENEGGWTSGIVTCPAAPPVLQVHHRMPLITQKWKVKETA